MHALGADSSFRDLLSRCCEEIVTAHYEELSRNGTEKKLPQPAKPGTCAVLEDHVLMWSAFAKVESPNVSPMMSPRVSEKQKHKGDGISIKPAVSGGSVASDAQVAEAQSESDASSNDLLQSPLSDLSAEQRAQREMMMMHAKQFMNLEEVLPSPESHVSFSRHTQQSALSARSSLVALRADAGVGGSDSKRVTLFMQRLLPTLGSNFGQRFEFVSGAKNGSLRRNFDFIRYLLRRSIKNSIFELVFTTVIMANALVMAVESQRQGIAIGHEIEYHLYFHHQASGYGSADWAHADDVFYALSWMFGLLFAIEVFLKMACLQSCEELKFYFRDVWNVLDIFVVLLFFFEQLPTLSGYLELQHLRLLRLGRLGRLLRLVRTLDAFESLYVMKTALRGSVGILLWSFAFLFVVQVILALFLCNILHMLYFEDTSRPLGRQREVYQYFGTFSRSVLSLFELTLANWPPVCRLLIEEVTEWFTVFCLLHKITIGFAVIGVINGCFMQETVRAVAGDDQIKVRERKKQAEKHRQKMLMLFEALDQSGDNNISLNEFLTIALIPDVQSWLESMELEADDLEKLFRLIDVDESGFISFEELLVGVEKLRGSARSLDLMDMMAKLKLTGSIHEDPNPVQTHLMRSNCSVASSADAFAASPVAEDSDRSVPSTRELPQRASRTTTTTTA